MSSYQRTTDRPYRDWTPTQIAFLKQWYGIINVGVIAECTHHTRRAVQMEAARQGISVEANRQRFIQFNQGRV